MTLLHSQPGRLGSGASEFELEGTDGKTYTLRDFEDAKVLVIVFMCNHCPYVQVVWKRLVDLQKKFEGGEGAGNVRFVGINPNFHPDYPEETMGKMKEYYERYEMNFPYLLDESQSVAREYGAVCTPDIFVYDAERRLRYRGRIDDDWKNPKNVKKYELKDAIFALLKGGEPDENQNPSMGCSIKWRNK